MCKGLEGGGVRRNWKGARVYGVWKMSGDLLRGVWKTLKALG